MKLSSYPPEVTAVCSGANAGFVKSLGADKVIDYRSEEFTKGSARYDIILDAVAKRSFHECKNVPTPKGIYVGTLPSVAVIVNQHITGFLISKKARFINVSPNPADMEWMKEQIEADRIKIVIDRKYSLDQIKETFAYSESGRVKGKIVLTMAWEEATAQPARNSEIVMDGS